MWQRCSEKASVFAVKGQKKMQEDVQSVVDLEVEIVDLECVHDRKRPRAGWRFTRGQRRVGTIVTVIIYLVTLGLLVSTFPGLGARIWQHLFPAGAAPRTASFYLSGNPSWGHFTIDGQPVAHLPIIGRDRPLALPPGTYTIDWHTAPFRPQRCTLSLTLTRAPTVGPSCVVRSVFVGGRASRVQVVCFFASLHDLPPAQQAQVLHLVGAALAGQDEQAIVQPGEWYALAAHEPGVAPALCRSTVVGALCATRATRTLHATLQMQMDAGDPAAAACRFLCPNPEMAPGARGWNVQIPVRGSWMYTPLSGPLSEQPQPLSFDGAAPVPQVVSLYLTWSQRGWQALLLDAAGMIDSPERNPLCRQAAHDLQRISGPGRSRAGLVQVVGASASAPAEGCLVAFALAGRPQALAYCLARFGVLLAANDRARRLWPYLPVASAQEQQLVARLSLPAPGAQ